MDERLVGTWSLRTYQLIGSRGRVRYPYGEDAVGFIVYGPDGFMTVSIMAANRQLFAGGGFRRRSAVEGAEATRTYLSYCGRYEVQSDRLVHHIKMSLYPNWTGTSQVRFYRIDGETLELSSAPLPSAGSAPYALLIWEREPGQ